MMDYLIARKMGYSKYTAYSDVFGNGELGRTARQELAAHLSRLSGLYPELVGNHDSLAKVLISEINGRYFSMLEKGNLSDILEGAGIGIVFLVTMAGARQMLARGLITEDQYDDFDTAMREKYSPVTGDLFTNRNLI